MKEFEFTKGEWRVGSLDKTIVGTDYPIPKYLAICDKDKDVTKTEAKANAKLISAAPNILYALIDLVEIVENLPENKSILTALDNAKKAIDKGTK